jgi:hypothetical protein
MTSEKKAHGQLPQTGSDLERTQTAGPAAPAKRPWAPPRCRRLGLGGTDTLPKFPTPGEATTSLGFQSGS